MGGTVESGWRGEIVFWLFVVAVVGAMVSFLSLVSTHTSARVQKLREVIREQNRRIRRERREFEEDLRRREARMDRSYRSFVASVNEWAAEICADWGGEIDEMDARMKKLRPHDVEIVWIWAMVVHHNEKLKELREERCRRDAGRFGRRARRRDFRKAARGRRL